MDDASTPPAGESWGLGDDAAEGALDAALVSLWERGRAAWPDVTLEAPEFLRYVRARAPASANTSSWLEELRAGDLFLACASAKGVPQALRAFDAAFLTKMSVYLRPLRPTPELVAETKQTLLEKLFVAAEGRPPKIQQYSGRGALEGWVRVVALRTALNLLEAEEGRRPRLEEADEIARGVAPGCDPELEFMKSSYRSAFIVAFREAMASLPQQERNVLRFTFVEHLTPARVGAVYGVHRSTATRWIEAAQEEVVKRTRTRLMESLHLSPAECDDLFALVRSRIHLTLTSLLTKTA